jgi:hypothetical protein
MTKIDKQRLEFINNIDLSDWKQYKSYESPMYTISNVFMVYHEMMVNYRNLNASDFTKKYWLLFHSPHHNRLLKIDEVKINNQNAKFSINWETCRDSLLEDIASRMETELRALEKY